MRTFTQATDRFAVAVKVAIRPCRQDDIPALEWWGQYFAHRNTIEATYAAQIRGEALMLIADVNGYPAGQAWIDFNTRDEGHAVLWAVRVFPLLQGCGIGSRLIDAAERYLRQYGFEAIQLAVEKSNVDAQRFYERAGYSRIDEAVGSYSYTPPGRPTIEEPTDQWIMRKQLTETK